jgi:hypothetical protein
MQGLGLQVKMFSTRLPDRLHKCRTRSFNRLNRVYASRYYDETEPVFLSGYVMYIWTLASH